MNPAVPKILRDESCRSDPIPILTSRCWRIEGGKFTRDVRTFNFQKPLLFLIWKRNEFIIFLKTQHFLGGDTSQWLH
ncbi:hypothetical protein MA16_Dca016911 [Dendrobium catenatum]|uniref:Uncharacterized protein n=1 Tax=Dendrobium catenatum TaxID=906689 RepID=A0A2I0W4X6_9ASPA|nr:hypothetical protein MA16_Dca016911 [Dendrobium catenatum]